MDNLVKEYLDNSAALQRKYESLKFGKLMNQEKLLERYKPITEPLKELNNKLPVLPKDSPTSTKGDLSQKYLNPFSFANKKIDRVFGIRKEAKDLYFGAAPVEIVNDVLILHSDTGATRYQGTEGLWELLILQKPEHYNEKDLEQYADMVLRSYVYKQNNDKNSTRRKSNRGYKYINIIKPILDVNRDLTEYDDDDLWDSSFEPGQGNQSFVGSGLSKINTNKPVEYVYWNTIDELLERLCILYGQVKSGNSNPLLTNEIVNILQELREI